MAFGRSSKKQTKRIADRAVSAGEDAIATAAEYLGLKKAPPIRSSGEDAFAFIGGLLFGGLAAATAAILLAPTDGQTFRSRLSAKLDELLGRTDSDATPFEPMGDTLGGDPAGTAPVDGTVPLPARPASAV